LMLFGTLSARAADPIKVGMVIPLTGSIAEQANTASKAPAGTGDRG
jgi:ABC-type branched-subunit amino acid transport system substrate-binding protein